MQALRVSEIQTGFQTRSEGGVSVVVVMYSIQSLQIKWQPAASVKHSSNVRLYGGARKRDIKGLQTGEFQELQGDCDGCASVVCIWWMQ